MCGVAALVGTPHEGVDADAALRAIADRGPDGAARWSDDSLLLLPMATGRIAVKPH